MAGPIYALNLFNVADRDEYLAYSRRSAKGVQAHGGRVVALGKFREAAAGDIKPRSVMILVEWVSKAAFEGYCNDSKISDTARRAPATTSGASSTSRGPAADPQITIIRLNHDPHYQQIRLDRAEFRRATRDHRWADLCDGGRKSFRTALCLS